MSPITSDVIEKSVEATEKIVNSDVMRENPNALMLFLYFIFGGIFVSVVFCAFFYQNQIENRNLVIAIATQGQNFSQKVDNLTEKIQILTEVIAKNRGL